MSLKPIHKNLDTAFVNLSLLVKYLRNRQFVGTIKVQLNGYKAEIVLNADDKLSVLECDEISGRVSEGAEAFKRLLVRAKEPGGSINVFQKVEQSEFPEKKKTQVPKVKKPSIKTVEVKAVKNPYKRPKPVEVGVPKPSAPELLKQKATSRPTPPAAPKTKKVPAPKPETKIPVADKPALPDFPFELSNKFEQRAKPKKIAAEDWQALMKTTVELLAVIDRCLAEHGLEFAAAFRKARGEISGDYPFMNPNSGIFEYENSRLNLKKQINERIFVASISECVRRILAKLGQNPKFAIPHREVSHKIIALMNKRQTVYDRFGYTRPLRRMLGV